MSRKPAARRRSATTLIARSQTGNLCGSTPIEALPEPARFVCPSYNLSPQEEIPPMFSDLPLRFVPPNCTKVKRYRVYLFHIHSLAFVSKKAFCNFFEGMRAADTRPPFVLCDYESIFCSFAPIGPTIHRGCGSSDHTVLQGNRHALQ